MDYGTWYSDLVGYGFSLVAEAILVKNLIETMWEKVAPTSEARSSLRVFPWQGEALARVESVLYVMFLQLGLGYLIGLWVAMKVAGQWQRWSDPGDPGAGRPTGWTVLNVFMIGNALTILYAGVGFKLIGWVEEGRVLRIGATIAVVFALTLALWMWIVQRRSHEAT